MSKQYKISIYWVFDDEDSSYRVSFNDCLAIQESIEGNKQWVYLSSTTGFINLNNVTRIYLSDEFKDHYIIYLENKKTKPVDQLYDGII